MKILAPAAMIVLLNASAHAAGGHDHESHSKGEAGFYGHLDVNVHIDSITDAKDADEEFDEVYTHSHMELGFRVNPQLSINSNIKIEGEPAGHAHGHSEEADHEGEEGHEEEAAAHGAGGDKVFDGHPLIVEQLTINFETENLQLYAGKFNPVVGIDYHNVPGIFGYQVIESYIIRERIGLGAKLMVDADDFGQHSLNISSFFADTTALSGALLSSRKQTRKEDGGLANTEDFQSFAVSLGGDDFYSLDNNVVEGLSYRLGFATQAAGIGNEKDEVRYSAAFGYEHKFAQDFGAQFITEYMAIDHLGGEAAHDRSYTTAALNFDYQAWNLGASYTHIKNDAEESDESHNGHIQQISLGYTFANGVGFGVGYKRADEDNEVNDRVGARLTYSVDF